MHTASVRKTLAVVFHITLLIVIDISGSSGYNTFAALQYADARRIADAHALMYTM